jgi:methyl-accepting chemotaxis protein
MKNLSLNLKMSFVLGVFVVACGVISFSGISSNGKMNEAIENILDRDLKVQNALNLRGMLRLMIIQEKNVLHAETQSERDDAIKKIADLEKESAALVEAWKKYASDFAKPKLNQIESILSSWHESDVMVIQHVQKGESKEAVSLSYHKGREYRLALEKLLDELVEFNNKGMDAAKSQAASTARNAKNTLILVSLLSVFLGLSLGVSILRGLAKVIDQIISKLTSSSVHLSSTAQQVASASEELSQSVSEQASSLQETAASIQEMSSMVTKNSENAERASFSSNQSQQTAAKGKEAVAEMLQAIENISASNVSIMEQTNRSNAQLTEIVNVISEIGSKTKVINDIVFQTKLLSFNASVEAARAGEHGKGFAVVAEEVGNLAQMSGNAAKDISSMLDSSIQKVEAIVTDTKTRVEALVSEGKDRILAGAKIAQRCGTVLDEIVGGVSGVSQMAGDISTASREQSQGVQEITKAMSQLDQVTQQNSAASEQAASAAEELSTQAAMLQTIVKSLVTAIKGDSDQDFLKDPGSESRASAQILSFTRNPNPTRGVTSEAPLKKASGHDATPASDDGRFRDV